MTIVVCPLSKVEAMVGLHRPGHVISLLDPELSFPELGPDYEDRHLRLGFHDVNFPAQGEIGPSTEHVRALLGFLAACDGTAPILIHCHAGISRSTATAFIVACYTNPEADELEVARALRRASPLARPNETLVAIADREMGREGRMIGAIVRTGRGLGWIDVHENEPFRFTHVAPDDDSSR